MNWVWVRFGLYLVLAIGSAAANMVWASLVWGYVSGVEFCAAADARKVRR